MRDGSCGGEGATAVGERGLGDVDDPHDAGVSRWKQRAWRCGSGKWAAHARAPADGISCLPRRTTTPGSSPADRFPVVLHPNASHGLAPPYGAALTCRHRAEFRDVPEAGLLGHETIKD